MRGFFSILLVAILIAGCGAALQDGSPTVGPDSQTENSGEPVQEPKKMTFTVVWDAPTSFTDNIPFPSNYRISYRIYLGSQSRSYNSIISVDNTEYRFTQLPEGTYYLAVTAVDEQTGLESDFSNEISVTLPMH